MEFFVQETKVLLSKRLTGRPKTEEHRQAIAAGQRRRVAATRLCSFINACDQSADQDNSFPFIGQCSLQ